MSSTSLSSLLFEAEFSLAKLKQIKSPFDVAYYLQTTLDFPISAGRYRKVFELGADKVVKVAATGEVEQNKREVKNSKCLGKKYAAQVLLASVDYVWIIAERVKPLSKQEFEALFSDKVGMALKHDEIVQVFAGPGVLRQQLAKKSQWFAKLWDRLRECEVGTKDFHFNNWGVREATGELVLLDLGF